ncbi:MAG: hypothetical protein RR740_09050 [Pseudomonas sp.]
MAGDDIGATLTGRALFLSTLALAELNAGNQWEIDFTNDMRNRFEIEGDRLVMTQLQQTTLRRIAGLSRRNWTI